MRLIIVLAIVISLVTAFTGVAAEKGDTKIWHFLKM